MSHPQRRQEEQGSSFTITQIALGSPLQFEPALGSPELDSLINDYVPGYALPQQKRAQVVLEFLNSIDALSYSHPVSIRYHVPQVLTPQAMPRHSSMPSLTPPSLRTSNTNSTIKEETLSTSKSTGSLKRAREEVAPPNASSAKRLPGFSIMTRDGIDITDLASRGPKTKEQREHAALMRRLKACAACKKSKQRCDPSHHRLAQLATSTDTPSNPSAGSARPSCFSSSGGSQGSISPESSLGESFSQSPSHSFVDRATAHMGQGFPHLPLTRPHLSPSDFTLPDTYLTEIDTTALPLQDFDPQLFQMADMELDSWSTDFTAFPPVPPVYNVNDWNSHEDIFAPNYGYEISPGTRSGASLERVESSSLQHDPTFADQSLHRQTREGVAQQSLLLDRDLRSSGSQGIDFDIDQWLHSTVDLNRNDGLPQQSASGETDMLRRSPLQRSFQNGTTLRDQQCTSLDRAEAHDTFAEVYESSPVEVRQQSWRTTISSDLPGEDEKRYLSTETVTPQVLARSRSNRPPEETTVLEGEETYQAQQNYPPALLRTAVLQEKRTIVIISLCMMMVISLLCTISLLTSLRSNPSVSSLWKQDVHTAMHSIENKLSPENSRNEMRSFSLGLDHESPSQSDQEPGFDHTSSSQDYWPENNSLLTDDISNNEDYPVQRIERQSPSPTSSHLSGTPAFTMAPSTTKCGATWTTQLPTRCATQPKKPNACVTSPSQRQSSSSKFMSDFKRTWTRGFNIGHLTMKVTSLTII